jgi:hypothetical protein
MTPIVNRTGGMLVVAALVLSLPAVPAAQQTQKPRHAGQGSAAKRTAWTLIGAGLGFGAGLLVGMQQFDDAINSDQKVWTSAIAGAAAGGLAGNLLSRSVKPSVPRQASPISLLPTSFEFNRTAIDRPAQARVRSVNASLFGMASGASLPALSTRRPAGPQTATSQDPLWNGMAVGAAIGGIIGIGVVPASECKPSNPECPALLRVGVGIPAVAGGAAIGALIDKLWK